MATRGEDTPAAFGSIQNSCSGWRVSRAGRPEKRGPSRPGDCRVSAVPPETARCGLPGPAGVQNLRAGLAVCPGHTGSRAMGWEPRQRRNTERVSPHGIVSLCSSTACSTWVARGTREENGSSALTVIALLCFLKMDSHTHSCCCP